MDRLQSFRCPRWANLPDLGLYLDQVLLVLDQTLGPVTPESEKGVITATIINNYVKQKVLAPTNKKKYDRGHLADLVMIALLKRVLTTAEMVRLLAVLKADRDPQQAYDLFCDTLETTLAGAAVDEGACPPLVLAAVRTLAGKMAFELLLEQTAPAPLAEKPAKPEKGQKKKAPEETPAEAQAE